MSESTLGTPQNQKPENIIDHSGNLPINEGGERPSIHFPDLATLQEALKDGKLENIRWDADTQDFVADLPDTLGEVSDPSKSPTTEFYVPLDTESTRHAAQDKADDSDTKEGKFFTPRKIVASLAVAAVAATVGVIGIARAGSPKADAPAPQPTASAEPFPTTTPDLQPTPDVTTASEAPVAESSMNDAERYMRYENNRFAKLPVEERLLGVNGQYLKQSITEGMLYTTVSPIHLDVNGDGKVEDKDNDGAVDEEKKFDRSQEKELIEYSPADISMAGDGESTKYTASPQDIMNQIVYAKASIWGQIKDYDKTISEAVNDKDPTDNSPQFVLDHNKSLNMISGLYYDLDSKEAKELARLVKNQTTAEKWSFKQYCQVDTASSNLSPFVADNGTRFEETLTINYKDPDEGMRHVIVAPIESTFTGPDPYMAVPEKTVTVVNWMIVAEGKGTVEVI